MFEYLIRLGGGDVVATLTFYKEPTDFELFSVMKSEGLFPVNHFEDFTYPADEHGTIRIIKHDGTGHEWLMFTVEVAN